MRRERFYLERVVEKAHRRRWLLKDWGLQRREEEADLT